MEAIVAYERSLVTRLIDGLDSIHGLTIHGITDRSRFDERVPTVSVSIDGVDPRAAATALGRGGIFVWDGDFYATGLIERLGKAESGGVLRLGLVHYNTAEEVDRTLEALERTRDGCRRVTRPDSIQARLARPFDPAELRRIKRLWVRHSIAEDRRDIDGLIATLSPDCVVRDRRHGPALGGPRRRAAVLRGAFRGVPGQRVRAVRDRRRPAGRVRGRDADRHEPGTVGGRCRRPGWPSRSRSLILFPWDRDHRAVQRRADLVRPRGSAPTPPSGRAYDGVAWPGIGRHARVAARSRVSPWSSPRCSSAGEPRPGP